MSCQQCVKDGNSYHRNKFWVYSVNPRWWFSTMTFELLLALLSPTITALAAYAIQYTYTYSVYKHNITSCFITYNIFKV